MTRIIKALDLSPDGVDAILAAVTDAGLTVYYNETDGDTTIDIHLRPVDSNANMIALSWRAPLRAWRLTETDAAGVEQCYWPLSNGDIEDEAASAARILAWVIRVEMEMSAEVGAR